MGRYNLPRRRWTYTRYSAVGCERKVTCAPAKVAATVPSTTTPPSRTRGHRKQGTRAGRSSPSSLPHVPLTMHCPVCVCLDRQGPRPGPWVSQPTAAHPQHCSHHTCASSTAEARFPMTTLQIKSSSISTEPKTSVPRPLVLHPIKPHRPIRGPPHSLPPSHSPQRRRKHRLCLPLPKAIPDTSQFPIPHNLHTLIPAPSARRIRSRATTAFVETLKPTSGTWSGGQARFARGAVPSCEARYLRGAGNWKGAPGVRCNAAVTSLGLLSATPGRERVRERENCLARFGGRHQGGAGSNSVCAPLIAPVIALAPHYIRETTRRSPFTYSEPFQSINTPRGSRSQARQGPRQKGDVEIEERRKEVRSVLQTDIIGVVRNPACAVPQIP